MLGFMKTRDILLRENPQLSFHELAKAMSEKYKQLSVQEMDRLDTLVKLDKERYQRELVEKEKQLNDYDQIASAHDTDTPLSASLVFPLGRIKRILKMDPDVRNISKESVAVITKVAEVFVGFLAQQSVRSAALRGSRSVKASDVFQTIHSNEIFSFLRMDFPRKLLNITTVNSTNNNHQPLCHSEKNLGIDNFFSTISDQKEDSKET
eukprot:gene18781-19088_t